MPAGLYLFEKKVAIISSSSISSLAVVISCWTKVKINYDIRTAIVLLCISNVFFSMRCCNASLLILTFVQQDMTTSNDDMEELEISKVKVRLEQLLDQTTAKSL